MQRYLPDCRAYERVSPPGKNGFDVTADASESPFVAGQASTDGTAVSFLTFGPMEGTPWGGSFGTHHYVSRRSSSGWTTEPLFPRPRGVAALTEVPAFSHDLRLSLLKASTPLKADGSDTDDGLYVRDEHGHLETVLLGPDSPIEPLVAQPDMSSIVFGSFGTLSPEPGQPDGIQKLYEFREGAFRLVSRAPGTNDPFAFFDSRLGAGPDRSIQNVISGDGRHIFFTNSDAGADDIYRRTDGATTALVSPVRRTVPQDYFGSRFEGASADGNFVFFTSETPMTDDANPGPARDLYRYDIAADQLVDLTAGTAGDAPAAVEHVVGLGDDGRSGYFVATGQVIPGQGVDGLPNLYLWEDDGSAAGSVVYIATLDPADVPATGWTRDRAAQVADGGRYLVFVSHADLLGANSAGTPQVYRFDADVADSSTALLCLSCAGGSTGSSGLGRRPGSNLSGGFPRLISEHGRRVVFSSENALVPRDSNGRYDAYLWQDGQPYLLSTGLSADDSWAYGMSTDGDQIFLRTREALTGDDRDRLVDLYAVPVGGGFPAGSTDSCLADDCRGPLVGGPDPLAPGTGGGGADDDAPGRLTLKRLGPAQLKRAARTGVLRLRVNLFQGGTVTGVAHARLRSGRVVKRRRVARTVKRFGRAGSGVLALRLTPGARRALARQGTLTLTLRVSLDGARPVTRRARLKRKPARSAAAALAPAPKTIGWGL